MLFKVLVPTLAVLSLANAHRGWHHGPPPPFPEDHSKEILENQAKILTGVQSLIKAVKDGQLLEMTFDMWMRQQNISKKLDTLVAKATAEKAEEKEETLEEELIEPETLPVEENLELQAEPVATETDSAPDMEKTQPPVDEMTRGMNILFK